MNFPKFISQNIISILAFLFLIHGSNYCLQNQKSTDLDTNLEFSRIDSLNDLCFELRGSDPVSALNFGEKALELAKKINYTKGMMRSNSFIGVSYRNISEYSTALSYYLKAYNLADSLNDFEQKAYGLINIGNLYFRQGKDSLGIKNFYEALEIANEIQDKRIVAYCYINIGRIYVIQIKWEDAIQFFHRAIDERRKLNDDWGIANTLIELADIYLKMGKFNSALNHYEKALNIATLLKTGKNLVGEIYTGMGLVYQNKKQYGLSDEYLNKSIRINKEIDNKRELMKAYQIISDNYRFTDNYAKALEYFKYYTDYKDSVVNIETNTNIAQLEIKFQTKEKEKDNELLRKQNELQETKISQQSTILNLFIIILVLIAVLIIVLVYRYRTNQKMNRLLVEKNIEIEKQKEELSNLNDTKDKFFSIIAHDLRNPFMNLITSSEYVIEEYYDMSDTDKLEIIKSLNSSARVSHALLENLLIWARSQRGIIEYEPIEFSFGEAVDEAIDLFQNSASNKGVNLYSAIEDVYLVIADRKMSDTVLRNLISNALKFTERGGEIVISAESRDDKIEVCIQDTGVGIPKNDLENIFKVEEKLSMTGTEGETGSGLGLIICKDFIEKNRGSISVTSEDGIGSKFYFTLPKAKII